VAQKGSGVGSTGVRGGRRSRERLGWRLGRGGDGGIGG
jgi:hypothetical protein